MSTEQISLRETITPRTEKWIRVSAVMAMLVVASSSAILSFDGLQKVALASRVPEHLAFLFPIAVDTTILMGSLAVLLYELVGVRSIFGWFTVMFGTVLSVTGNVISVADAGIIAQILHGIIPVLLCISLESLLRILRFNIKRSNKAHADHERGTQSEDSEKSILPNATSTVTEIKSITENLEPVKPVLVESVPPAAEKPAEVAEEEVPVIAEKAIVADAQPVSEANEPTVLAETIAEPSQGVNPTEPDVAPVSESSENSEDASATPVEVESPQTQDIPASSVATVEEKPEPKKPVRKAPAKRTAAKKAPVKRTPAKRAPAKKVDTVEPSPETIPNTSAKTASQPAPAKNVPVVPENVETYKIFLENLPNDLDRNQKAREIRKAFPEATLPDIKAAVLR